MIVFLLIVIIVILAPALLLIPLGAFAIIALPIVWVINSLIEYWYITIPVTLSLSAGVIYLIVLVNREKETNKKRGWDTEKWRIARDKYLAEEGKRKDEEEKREAEEKEREEIRRRLILEREVREELEAEQKNSKNKK